MYQNSKFSKRCKSRISGVLFQLVLGLSARTVYEFGYKLEENHRKKRIYPKNSVIFL